MAGRRLDIVGIAGERRTPEEVAAVLAKRRAAWPGFRARYTHGLLGRYTRHAVSAMQGAYLEDE